MMILFWLVALAVIVWAVQVIVRGRGVGGEARQGRAESLLDERYARGEIDEATHRRMLEELRR